MTSVLNRKVVLAVAPVGQSEDSFKISPKTPEHVANSIAACAREGAAMVHLHPRDAVGKPAHELSAFSRTLDLLEMEKADVIVQGSTGGLSTFSPEERCIAIGDPRVECASLNLGSINFGKTVYANPFPDVEYWAARMLETKVRPELQIFDIGMFNAAQRLVDAGLIAEPRVYSLVLGFEWGLPADAEMLEFTARRVPAGAMWGVIHHGMRDLELLKVAVGMGATFIRVGFEDSVFGPDGIPLATNHDLVAAAVKMLASYGGASPATPEEARKMLGLNRRG